MRAGEKVKKPLQNNYGQKDVSHYLVNLWSKRSNGLIICFENLNDL